MNEKPDVSAAIRLLSDRIKWYRKTVDNIETGNCDCFSYNWPMMDGISGPGIKIQIPNNEAYKSACKQSIRELELSLALIRTIMIQEEETNP